MTEAQLRDLLTEWAQRLGLDRWHLKLVIGGTDEATSYMETHRSGYYERGIIYVAPWLLGDGEVPDNVMEREPDDRFIEASLVHELLHLHIRDLRAVVRDDLDGQVHRDVHVQIEKAAERAEEQCVDRLAVALVRARHREPKPEQTKAAWAAVQRDQRQPSPSQ